MTSESVLFLPAASSYPTAEIEKALGPRDGALNEGVADPRERC